MAAPSSPNLLLNHPLVDRDQLKIAVIHFIVHIIGLAFLVALWLNYVLLQPYFSALFWAAALSVPLHALKCRVLEFVQQGFNSEDSPIWSWLWWQTLAGLCQVVWGRYLCLVAMVALREYLATVRSWSQVKVTYETLPWNRILPLRWQRAGRFGPVSTQTSGGATKRKDNPGLLGESITLFHAGTARSTATTYTRPYSRTPGRGRERSPSQPMDLAHRTSFPLLASVTRSRAHSPTRLHQRSHTSVIPASRLTSLSSDDDEAEGYSGTTQQVGIRSRTTSFTLNANARSNFAPRSAPGSPRMTPTIAERLSSPLPKALDQTTLLHSSISGEKRSPSPPPAPNNLSYSGKVTRCQSEGVPVRSPATTALTTSKTYTSSRISDKPAVRYSVKRRLLDRISPMALRTPVIPSFTFGDQLPRQESPAEPAMGKTWAQWSFPFFTQAPFNPYPYDQTPSISGHSASSAHTRLSDPLDPAAEADGWNYVLVLFRMALAVAAYNAHIDGWYSLGHLQIVGLLGVLGALLHAGYHGALWVWKCWIWWATVVLVWHPITVLGQWFGCYLPGNPWSDNHVGSLGAAATTASRLGSVPAWDTPFTFASGSTLIPEHHAATTCFQIPNADGIDPTYTRNSRIVLLNSIFESLWVGLGVAIQASIVVGRHSWAAFGSFRALGCRWRQYVYRQIHQTLQSYLNELLSGAIIVGLVTLTVTVLGYLFYRTVEETVLFLDISHQFLHDAAALQSQPMQGQSVSLSSTHPWLAQHMVGMSEPMVQQLILVALALKDELVLWADAQLRDSYPGANLTATGLYDRWRQQYMAFKGYTNPVPSPSGTSVSALFAVGRDGVHNIRSQGVVDKPWPDRIWRYDAPTAHRPNGTTTLDALQRMGAILSAQRRQPLVLKSPDNQQLGGPMADLRSQGAASLVQSSGTLAGFTPSHTASAEILAESTAVATDAQSSKAAPASLESSQCSVCAPVSPFAEATLPLSCTASCPRDFPTNAIKQLAQAVRTGDLDALLTPWYYWQAGQELYALGNAYVWRRYRSYRELLDTAQTMLAASLHRLSGEAIRALSLSILTLVQVLTAGFDLLFELLLFFFTLYSLLLQDQSILYTLGRVLIFVDGQQLLRAKLESSISGTVVSSVQLLVFHFLFTWITFQLFGIHTLLYTCSLVSGLVAMIPIAAPWCVAVPPTLWLMTQPGQFMNGLWLVSLHILATWVVDPVFYALIPGTNSLFAGLSVLLGLWAFGAQGFLLGPLAMTCLPAVYQLLSQVIMP
ncbi:hypothetical protein H4R34_000008 [Dimargaris verticillata]|uniref:Transmembrane protein n=1 Tax=Dimargaris verticillata TaxID=2761393 RepID=A0A9W8B6Y0_9FUNG|nr:hypothetical protein H4R34_000008 [Dimargaris verticillata]